ncbi:hypothetical protein [Blastococcus sp. TF02A-26]|uniref:hypothetical protein n=1 Tax=Blastococcus sp. TF02A-26 TaxID=2250577 RepID=UPI0011BE1620|nr:hypothetical protein [Blastococcus sp. TF02A-26]
MTRLGDLRATASSVAKGFSTKNGIARSSAAASRAPWGERVSAEPDGVGTLAVQEREPVGLGVGADPVGRLLDSPGYRVGDRHNLDVVEPCDQSPNDASTAESPRDTGA